MCSLHISHIRTYCHQQGAWECRVLDGMRSVLSRGVCPVDLHVSVQLLWQRQQAASSIVSPLQCDVLLHLSFFCAWCLQSCAYRLSTCAAVCVCVLRLPVSVMTVAVMCVRLGCLMQVCLWLVVLHIFFLFFG
jgi:hypothetical protein